MLSKSKQPIAFGALLTRGVTTTAGNKIQGCPANSTGNLAAGTSWENAKDFSEIPGPKPWPIIGNNWRFMPMIGNYDLTQFGAAFEKIRNEFGDIVRMDKVMKKMASVFVFKPEDIEMIYKSESHFPERLIFETAIYFRENRRQEIFKDVKGLVPTNGEEWYKIRSTVNPVMMQPKVVKQYIERIEDISREFIEKIGRNRSSDDKLSIDFMNESCKWALESVGAVALDSRLGCLGENVDPRTIQLMHANNQILKLSMKLDFIPSIWKYVSTPAFKKIMKAYDDQVTASKSFIDDAIARIKENKRLEIQNDREPSVLEKLYEIDPNIAVVMASDMLLAGMETTAHAFGTILYHLSINTDKQEILRKEILSVLPEKNVRIQEKNLNELPYVRACIKESFRMYPPGPGQLRTLTKDIVLSGYRIPKGVSVLYPMMVVSVDEKYFPRPLEFIPERWLRDLGDSELSYKRAHPFCLIPFGFGSRACVGMRFAELELEVAVINFIRNFEISWKGPPPTKITLASNFLNPPYNYVFKSLS